MAIFPNQNFKTSTRLKLCAFTLGLMVCLAASAAEEVIPAAPKQHFVDYTRKVKPAVALKIDDKLADFEQKNSICVMVAVFPRMQSEASIQDYTKRIAKSWENANKHKRAILFVFLNDHKLHLCTDTGTEKEFPDAECKAILDGQILPRFEKNDINGGLTVGVNSLLDLAKNGPVKK